MVYYDESVDKLSKDIAEKVRGFDTAAYHDEKLIKVIIDKYNEARFIGGLLESMVTNGATVDEIADIVRYSMVVLDAEEKKLDWRKAAEDFKVQEMKEKYVKEE